MTAKTETFAKLPHNLSFQRGIIVTDGAFYNLKSDKHLTNKEYENHPLTVVRHGIRATQNVISGDDTAKGSERSAANVQQTESAKTDHDAEGFVVSFGLRLIDLSSTLFACAADKPETTSAVRQSILDFAQRAKTSLGAEDVCRRMARNIANGSWLWRNRVSASSITVKVWRDKDCIAEFDALSIPMNHFNDFTDGEKTVARVLLEGLQGELKSALQITAAVYFGFKGSFEVYPSQAYIESKPRGFARPLYKLDPVRRHSTETTESAQVVGQAALRDQKISNRLRSIDTWYPDFDQVKRPIPVEPNGANLELMQLFRPKKYSAFTLFTRLNQIDPDTDDGKFCIAIMMRGGVLGEGDKGKEKAAAEEQS
ncbi:type I-F CRISPR-associated protein Csy3 [Amphibiibacter pelophylacis]|uniref:Type I-F CRISPR-associated protein Csy3 n=1 Tax=Amphibiibacter pelophylacis TaxID=1799477 RepID=A0ACC6P0V1_9BURK